MKKIITILAAAAVMSSGAFAMDMNIGLKGICGADNGAVKGTDIGGGVTLNMDISNGLGFQIESNIVTSKVTAASDGVTLADSFSVSIPVMGWYNWRFNNFAIGAGSGLSAVISNAETENAGSFKMCLAAGVNAKYFINDSFAIVLGATGNLDILPTLTTVKNESSTTYRFAASDYSKNSVLGSLGVEYRLPL